MWAILDKNTNQVIGMIEPTATKETVIEHAKKYNLIKMTPENSPAHLYGFWKNGKFTEKEGT